ncbi:MAG: hypothetical protein EKK61_03660 [Rickettsiales bacterium]|nr:MAG: hypothetical protein EKK61_03660 [Rickettsiales bacterium]
MSKKDNSEAVKKKEELLNNLSNLGLDGFSRVKRQEKQRESKVPQDLGQHEKPKKRISPSLKAKAGEIRQDLAKKLEKYDNRVANTVRKIIEPKAKSR